MTILPFAPAAGGVRQKIVVFDDWSSRHRRDLLLRPAQSD